MDEIEADYTFELSPSMMRGIVDDAEPGEFMYVVDGGDIYIVEYATGMVVYCDYLH